MTASNIEYRWGMWIYFCCSLCCCCVILIESLLVFERTGYCSEKSVSFISRGQCRCYLSLFYFSLLKQSFQKPGCWLYTAVFWLSLCWQGQTICSDLREMGGGGWEWCRGPWWRSQASEYWLVTVLRPVSRSPRGWLADNINPTQKVFSNRSRFAPRNLSCSGTPTASLDNRSAGSPFFFIQQVSCGVWCYRNPGSGSWCLQKRRRALCLSYNTRGQVILQQLLERTKGRWGQVFEVFSSPALFVEDWGIKLGRYGRMADRLRDGLVWGDSMEQIPEQREDITRRAVMLLDLIPWYLSHNQGSEMKNQQNMWPHVPGKALQTDNIYYLCLARSFTDIPTWLFHCRDSKSKYSEQNK